MPISDDSQSLQWGWLLEQSLVDAEFRFTGTPPQQPKQPVNNAPIEGARFIIDALNEKPTEP
jgi:hypothetical protein